MSWFRRVLVGLTLLAACGEPADSAGEGCVDHVDPFRDRPFEAGTTPPEDGPSEVTATWDGSTVAITFTDELGRMLTLKAVPDQ